MATDQDLGGHLEVAVGTQNVVSNANKIILSLLSYTGNIWPKILRTKFSDHVSADIYARENVR